MKKKKNMNKKTKILLVEDDPNLGTLLSEYLVAKGNECTLRTNGQEGFETFVKGTFDFLILDVMMPYKDGFTLAKEIREENNLVPIFFLTAKNLKEDVYCRIKPSKKHGVGVFAIKDIPKDIPWVLQIQGHTDQNPINTALYPSNWELSAARAISVGRVLMLSGVSSDKISVAGCAEFQPLEYGNDPSSYRKNRRILPCECFPQPSPILVF